MSLLKKTPEPEIPRWVVKDRLTKQLEIIEALTPELAADHFARFWSQRSVLDIYALGEHQGLFHTNKVIQVRKVEDNGR